MRLWHYLLIPRLPRQQLLGQHRECCALRGNGWGKKHAIVDYVFTHDPSWLLLYHYRIMSEMYTRGYNYGVEWVSMHYRGKSCSPWEDGQIQPLHAAQGYPEHDNEYLEECLDNLNKKGAILL